jgi:hypothetical protein
MALPCFPAEFIGYSLECLVELTVLSDLARLSLPLSLDSCIMNMPEVVIILARDRFHETPFRPKSFRT